MLERACNALALLDAIDLIQRTCELARVFGIDFFSVISRGSQYRCAPPPCRHHHCVPASVPRLRARSFHGSIRFDNDGPKRLQRCGHMYET